MNAWSLDYNSSGVLEPIQMEDELNQDKLRLFANDLSVVSKTDMIY